MGSSLIVGTSLCVVVFLSFRGSAHRQCAASFCIFCLSSLFLLLLLLLLLLRLPLFAKRLFVRGYNWVAFGRLEMHDLLCIMVRTPEPGTGKPPPRVALAHLPFAICHLALCRGRLSLSLNSITTTQTQTRQQHASTAHTHTHTHEAKPKNSSEQAENAEIEIEIERLRLGLGLGFGFGIGLGLGLGLGLGSRSFRCLPAAWSLFAGCLRSKVQVKPQIALVLTFLCVYLI